MCSSSNAALCIGIKKSTVPKTTIRTTHNPKWLLIQHKLLAAISQTMALHFLVLKTSKLLTLEKSKQYFRDTFYSIFSPL